MRHWLDGLRLQLLGVFILPFSLALLALAVAGTYVHEHAMRGLLAEREQRAVQAAAAAISEELLHRQSMVQVLSRWIAEGTPAESALSGLPHVQDDFADGLGAFEPDGDLIYGTGALDRTSLEPLRAMVRSVPEGSPILEGPLLESRGAFYAVAARTGDRVVLGIFDLDALLETAFPEIMSEETPPAVLLTDSQGVPLVSAGRPMPELPTGSHPGITAALAGQVGSLQLPDESVAAFSPVGPGGWALVVQEPWQNVTSPLLNLSLLTPLVLVPALLGTVLALWFGARQVIRPLRSLEQQAARWAEGDYSTRTRSVGGIAEVRHLESTLASMASRIHAAQKALREFIHAITHAQEDERRRLARELHDQTIQDLIALDQRVQILGMDLQTQDAATARQLEDLHRGFTDAIQEVRRVTRALRPNYLEDLGLVPALQMLAQDAQAESGLPIFFEVGGTSRRISPEAELAMYRIVQEALRNAGRHASAKHCRVNVEFTERLLRIAVIDDGAGFTAPSDLRDLSAQGHFGLMGMKERADLVGARLAVTSARGSGTRIQVEIDLPPASGESKTGAAAAPDRLA